MTDGHPLVWLWLLLVGSTISINTTNPVLLLVLVVALGATGFMAGGPRRASFVTALGAALAAALVWVGLTLVLPRGSAADALLMLPSWSPGPGVTFGGPLGLTSVVGGLVGALRAAAVVLLFGLAGQLVSARGWLALSRSTLGAGAPALHPLACVGEASVEALASRQRVAQQRWGSGAAAGWLTSLLLAARDIARADRPRVAPRPGVEIIRLLMLLLLTAGPVLALAAGVLPTAVTTHLFGTDLIALVVVLAVVLGLALPGTPSLVWQWRASDVPQAAAALVLTLAWALRGPLGQTAALNPPPGDLTALPWALAGAAVLLPLAVGLTGQRTPRRVAAHA
ncbi:hypothetical protein [Tessaracoccus antarcticus]|uniref:Uncharacterized protein n=1 Tax=Tessaracoccus antarcticus TaxID=2479848 RepID=A0A3M0G9Q6_9ACTN|nr:hypothetical protein [Tessaracoccus antarcticus]RMB58343.1 hypothetical protein EAX62_14180 [Tessaracoccus antarcticus]